MDLNATINLPKTDFPMRAGLPAREPEMLKRWQDEKLYERLMEKNADKPLFVLHDGPPYANGDVHMGTAMNKVLKDFILRYKNMSGFKAPYVPGWDTHGLPIESAILKSGKVDRSKVSVPEFRDLCRDFAMGYVASQREQFMRLGVLGDWFDPYLTLKPEFEARQIEVFGEIAEKGYIYKGMKPVYWCPHDETALAEAEIEYSDDSCDSIYVKFRVGDDKGMLPAGAEKDKTFFVIWTTTTWTLPGNLAVCLNGEHEYAFVKTPSGETYVLAEELVEPSMKAAKIDGYEILGTVRGAELEHMTARHPFLDRESLVILGDHVTLESGTGCVHTAPGHGMEDFAVCKNYKIETIVPVDSKGFMTKDAGPFEGLYYEKANAAILENLRESGALLATERIEHTYPHCWRCKEPIVFRATEQWFASVDAFKEEAVAAAGTVSWHPAWGLDRITSMIRERADWCISRQRNWGVPIPIFYCKGCDAHLINRETVKSVADIFRAEGSNAWFSRPASELLPQGMKCPSCGCGEFTKETDIMDVWFDSGVSHFAVLESRDDLRWPADVYLEGGDQYRGWFQSSLLTSVAVTGKAPYRAVLSHGWTVDGEGKKMSKSLGNTVLPQEIVKEYGADILRLWVASSDYTVDVRISKEIFRQLSEMYLKVRNTCRFILGNLNGFDPDGALPYDELFDLDKWALMRLNRLIARVRAAYDRYEYHTVHHAVHNFCVVDLSNFYLDVIKDRLYCDAPDSVSRRAAQTTIYKILSALVRLLAPIMAYTSEEIWSFMKNDSSMNPGSVLFNPMPETSPEWELSEADDARWEKLLALRADVNRVLETARAGKTIGKPLEAAVTLYAADSSTEEFLRASHAALPALLIVSSVNILRGTDGDPGASFPEASVSVAKAGGEKCPRCWMFKELNEDGLCPRCGSVVKDIDE